MLFNEVFNKLYTSGEKYLPGSRPCGAGGDHSAGDVHHPGQHPELAPPRGLHQGHRRLVRGLCRVRVFSSPGVCSGQLRFQVLEKSKMEIYLFVTFHMAFRC